MIRDGEGLGLRVRGSGLRGLRFMGVFAFFLFALCLLGGGGGGIWVDTCSAMQMFGFMKGVYNVCVGVDLAGEFFAAFT